MVLIYSTEFCADCWRIKAALDPAGTCNPDKVFPTPGRCLEMFSGKGAVVGW